MARPEDEDSALVSPLSQQIKFDSRKLGHLTLARRAISIESEATRSAVWNLPPELGIPRYINLDPQTSTRILNLNSLRKLATSPTKGDVRRPSDGMGDECVKTARTTEDPLERLSTIRYEASLVDTDVETACAGLLGVISMRHGPHEEKANREAIPQAGSVVNATLLQPRASTTIRASLRSGVDDKALAAVAELARRRRSEAESIVLPTNRPFLVGELASRKQQQQAAPLSPLHTVCEPTNSSPLMSTSHKEAWKEELDISILSKLLFFGGTSLDNMSSCTPEACSPDVTMSPLSRSECSDGSQHSYLLQLGQIMGGVTPKEPVHRPALDLDETAQSTSSTITSVEYSVAQKSETPPRVRRNLRRFLFLMTCFVSSWMIFQDGGSIIGILEAAKSKPVPYTREQCNTAVRRVELLLLKVTGWAEVYTPTVDWLHGNIVLEYVVLPKWHSFTQYTLQTLMVMAPVKTETPIITLAQVTPHVQWNFRSNISIALSKTHRRVATLIETKSGKATLDRSLGVSSEERPAIPTNETHASGREHLEGKALAIITKETKRRVASLDETEREEIRLGRSSDDSSEKRPAQAANETPTPNSVSERPNDKVMANTTLDSSRDYSLVTQLASHSNSVPSKHNDSTSSFLKYQAGFWKAYPAGASFLSLEPRRDYAKLLSCFFSDVTLNQCHPSTSANICCESEFFETNKRVVVPRTNAAFSAEMEEDDGFLQIPLVDIVGHFLQERLKKRQKRGRSVA